MQTHRGFTIIELIIFILLLIAIGITAFVQIQDIQASERDNQRKADINAIYYGLEKVFNKENDYYPEVVNTKVLPYVSPDSFKDPNGYEINNRQSNYRYAPSGCVEGKCEGYTLRTVLQKESDFIKTDTPS